MSMITRFANKKVVRFVIDKLKSILYPLILLGSNIQQFYDKRRQHSDRLVVIASIVTIILGIILFPVTAIGSVIRSFYYTRNKNIDRSTVILAMVTSATFPLPIIGPMLTYKFGNNYTFDGINILRKDKMNPFEFILQSYPFMSSFIAITQLEKIIFL